MPKICLNPLVPIRKKMNLRYRRYIHTTKQKTMMKCNRCNKNFKRKVHFWISKPLKQGDRYFEKSSDAFVLFCESCFKEWMKTTEKFVIDITRIS